MLMQSFIVIALRVREIGPEVLELPESPLGPRPAGLPFVSHEEAQRHETFSIV